MSTASLSDLGLDRGFFLLLALTIVGVVLIALTGHLSMPFALLLVVVVCFLEVAGVVLMSL